jgi:DNA polymerase-3 subunit alpha
VGKAAQNIIEARAKKGRFDSIFDLCASVDLRLVNKKCLESLVCAGALDSLKGTRAALFASIDKAIDYGNGFQRDRQSGQTSLFETGGSASATKALPEPQLADVPPWAYNELLAKEKEVLNFYVSGHPLMRFQDEIKGFSDITLRSEALERLKENASLSVGGLVTGLKTHMQRDGRPMAFLMRRLRKIQAYSRGRRHGPCPRSGFGAGRRTKAQTQSRQRARPFGEQGKAR